MKRLLEGSLPPRAATLLRSATTDVPPRAADEKARLTALVSSELVTPDAGRRIASGKWPAVLSVAAVVAVGAMGTGYYLSSPAVTPQTTASDDEPMPVSLHVPPAEHAEVTTPSPPKSIAVTDLPSVPVLPAPAARPQAAPTAEPARAAAASSTALAASTTPGLQDELRAIDAARAAFVEHAPAVALERVESYRRRFPSGHFMDEAEALEIQSLAALGRNEDARARAERFLAARPASPYAQRVRSAIGIKK